MNVDPYAFAPRKLRRVLAPVTIESAKELRDRWRASWTEAAFYLELVELEAKECARKKRDKIVTSLVTGALVGLFLLLALLVGHASWSNT